MDHVYGFGGNDNISVHDAGSSTDIVDCGPGTDTVLYDLPDFTGDVIVPGDLVITGERLNF